MYQRSLGGKMGHFSLYPQKNFRLAYFHLPMDQMIPTMSHIIVTHDQNFFSKNYQKIFFQGSPLCLKKWEPWLSIIVIDHMVWLPLYFFICYKYIAHGRYHLVHRWMKIGQSEKKIGVKGKMAHFTPLVTLGTQVIMFIVYPNVYLPCL